MTTIYSDDGDIAKLAGARMKVVGISDLPLPPEDAQGDIFNLLSPDPPQDGSGEPD